MFKRKKNAFTLCYFDKYLKSYDGDKVCPRYYGVVRRASFGQAAEVIGEKGSLLILVSSKMDEENRLVVTSREPKKSRTEACF